MTASTVRRPNPRLVVLVAWLAFFLVSFDYTAASVALPTLTTVFDASTSSISWISLVYYLAIACFLFPASVVVRNLGYRTALLLAFAVFAAASLGCSFAESLPVLLVFRVIQGISAAALYFAGPTMVRDLVGEEQRQRAFAVLASAGPAGIAAGPAIGGLVINFAGGQSVFLANVPLALWAVWLVARNSSLNRDPAAERQRINLPGLVLMASGSAALVLALNQGREWGWSSVGIIALFLFAGTALCAFVFEERVAKRPLIHHSLFSNRLFRNGNFAFFFTLIPFGGLIFLLPFYLQWYQGYSAYGTGLMLTIPAIAKIVASVASGWLPASASARLKALSGVCVMLAGIAILLFVHQPGGAASLVAALMAIGAGSGILIATVMQTVMGSLSDELTAVGSAVQSQVRTMAQLLGVVLLETVFAQIYISPSNAKYGAAASPSELAIMLEAFRYAFWLGIVCLIFAVLPILRLSKSHLRQGNGAGQ